MIAKEKIDIKKGYFGIIDNQLFYQYVLKTGFVILRMMNYCVTITSLVVPDKRSQVHYIIVGFSTLERIFVQKYLQFFNAHWSIHNRIEYVF